MCYPGIRHYKETILNPAGLFKTLGEVEAVRDSHGQIVYVSGSNSVIFKISIKGEFYVLKCYTKINRWRDRIYEKLNTHIKSNDSPYLVEFKYLKDEIYVFDDNNRGAYYSTLLMRYVEGETLGDYIKSCCYKRDKEALAHIAHEFDLMALWLLKEDLAHSDLKYDNIIVTPDNRLQLIDYDGMYLPLLDERHSTELGTRNFQHPRRDKNFFNSHLDDFSIALISVILHTLQDNPLLYNENDIMLEPEELIANKCDLINQQKEIWLNRGETALYSLASMLNSNSPILDKLSDKLLLLTNSKTKVAEEAEYDCFEVREGMKIICRDGLYGFINCETGDVIATIYDDARQFSQNVAAVRILKHWFYIDKTGKKVIDAKQYDEVGIFKDGLSVVRKNNKYGYIDLLGRLIIPLAYDDARTFNSGVAMVKVDKTYGIINNFGKFVVEPQFNYITDLKNHLLL